MSSTLPVITGRDTLEAGQVRPHHCNAGSEVEGSYLPSVKHAVSVKCNKENEMPFIFKIRFYSTYYFVTCIF